MHDSLLVSRDDCMEGKKKKASLCESKRMEAERCMVAWCSLERLGAAWSGA